MFLLVLPPNLRAEGALTGHVRTPEGTSIEEFRLVLIPEKAGAGRRTVRLNKKGEYFFGLVPDGRYTLGVEGTQLVPRTIKVLVHDTETRKDVLDYDGPPPQSAQVFEVKGNLKVTYDLVLGTPGKGPETLDSRIQEVPALLQSGDYTGALARLEAALEEHPDDPSLHYYSGFASFKMKEYTKAKAELGRALELNGGQVVGHWVMGAVLASEGNKLEAVSEFQKELDNPQTDAATRLNASINIGVLQRDLGNREAAIAAFEKVLELDNQQREAYSYLADLYLAMGKAEKAEEIQAKSRSLGLEDPNAIFNLGATQWNNKEFTKAEEAFRRVVDLDPKFALAWKSLGYALMNLDKKAEASEALKKYLELSPQAADAEDVRAFVEALGKK